MAIEEANVLPFINQVVIVTAPFGEYPSGGEHKGVDISDGLNSNVYSIVNGVITDKGYTASGFGNYIVMKDLTTNQGFLYGHLKEASPLNVGDLVEIGTFIGIEGTTGHSTGIHLHVESQDMTGKSRWTFGLPITSLLNPTIYMGFSNVTGTQVIYYGTPKFRSRKKWKWQKLKNFNIYY